MTLDAETKRARNQKLSYRAIYLLKAFDVFRFKPVPQHIEGDTGSSWGVLGSIVLFIIVVTYFVSSFVRYTNQSPSVSVVTMYAPQYGEVISFSYSLKNPEVLNTPSTRSPSLTIDESYFLFSVVLTSAEERFRNDLNTMYLNTTLCQTEWQDARRTTSYTGYCPSQPGGECSAAVVCFDAKEAPPDAFLAGDCTISPNCRRVEVIATTCSELNWQLSHLTFVNYTYPVVPIPKAPPPSSWTMRLGAVNTSASGTLGRIEAAWGSKPWGWVCNDGFDLNETEVWCRNLGLPTKYAWQLSPSSGLYPLATDDQPYYVSASRCMNASSNAFFSDCGYAFINRTQDQDCGPSEAVGIYCGNVKPYEFEYALRNSSFPTAGLLVIRPKGTTNWATIMNDNFTQADGMAACRAMGYNVTGVQILPPGYYGRGQSNSYFVTKSNCDKTNKEALHECAEIQYADFRQKQVNKDIALDCSFIYYDLKWQYRLIDGITSTNDTTATGRGMVQVRPTPDAPWGGVCSFDWNGLSAGAFCRALGYAIPTARAIRQPAITSMYSPDNIYMEQMGCNATIGVLEDCPFKYFPPGSEWSEHSYDCGGFSPYATWDAQLNNIALAAFVDCNYECATPEEIQSMALSTSLLVNLSLSRAGVPTPTVAAVAVSTDFLQQGTFALAHYNTSVAPDFFYRFFQKVFYDMTLVSFTPQVKSLYQNFLGMNNTQSIPLVSLSLSMSSSTILENQAVQNLADLVGAVYAFYASIFGFLAIFLATWNKHKFYTKHPGWQRVQDDLTVKPGDANEDDEQKSISANPGETSNTPGTELAYPMLPLPDTEMQPV